MKFILMLPALILTTGCTTPSARSHRPPVDETSCRAAIRDALVYQSTPRNTMAFFRNMASSGGADGKHMDAYYSTLGVNISSIAFVMDEELDARVSLNLADMDPAQVAAWLSRRIPNGKSLVDLEDVDGTFFDGEFIRVDLKSGSMVQGYFYVHCGVIEGRDIEEKVFVDYLRPGDPEPRKLSLAALLSLM